MTFTIRNMQHGMASWWTCLWFSAVLWRWTDRAGGWLHPGFLAIRQLSQVEGLTCKTTTHNVGDRRVFNLFRWHPSVHVVLGYSTLYKDLNMIYDYEFNYLTLKDELFRAYQVYQWVYRILIRILGVVAICEQESFENEVDSFSSGCTTTHISRAPDNLKATHPICTWNSATFKSFYEERGLGTKFMKQNFSFTKTVTLNCHT